jgi:hypothetical protein
MSSSAPGPRPRQVTVGGWVVAIASAMLVVSVFDSMARLRSVDTRDELTRVLTTGSAKDLGISVADALDVVRAALFVAGTAAAITAILGIFVLQRHAAARIVLTIAAVPLVLTSPFSGGFLPVLVAGGTALLWSRPARDWFAGRAPAPRAVQPTPVQRERPDVGPAHPRAAWAPPTITPPRPDATPGAPTPSPTPGWGQRVTVPPAWPAYASPQPAPPAPGEVPKQVRIAAILTWIFSLVTAGLYALIAVALLVDRGDMLKLLRDNPTVRDSKLSDDELVTVIVAVAALIILWCLAACVLAFLAWRRHSWAWILLMVSLGPAFVVELAAFPYSLLHLAAAAISLRMLLMPPVRAWFRGADHGTPPAGWSPPPSWGPPSGWAPPPPPSSPPPGAHGPAAPDQAPGAEPSAPEDQEPPRMPSGKPPVW